MFEVNFESDFELPIWELLTGQVPRQYSSLKRQKKEMCSLSKPICDNIHIHGLAFETGVRRFRRKYPRLRHLAECIRSQSGMLPHDI